jgi:methylmalonyl-CoA carboxyltransferase small subunit
MKLQIKIDDMEYEAEIEVLEDDTRPVPNAHSSSGSGVRAVTAPAPVVMPPPGLQDAGAKGCRSSVVGIVVRLLAKVGQVVTPGETLLVLEAMKMESNVTAPMAGKVKAIPVKQGEGVTKGQLLVEFE